MPAYIEDKKSLSAFAANKLHKTEFPTEFGYLSEHATMIPLPLVPLVEDALRLIAGKNKPWLYPVASELMKGQHLSLAASPPEEANEAQCKRWINATDTMEMRGHFPGYIAFAPSNEGSRLELSERGALDVSLFKSEPDFCLRLCDEKGILGKLAVAAVDVKRRHNSALEGQSQAMLVAIGTAVKLWQAGCRPEEVVVPFLCYTGLTVAFGAAYLLPSGMPCAALCASIMLVSLEDAMLASAHLLALMKQAQAVGKLAMGVGAAALTRIQQANPKYLLPGVDDLGRGRRDPKAPVVTKEPACLMYKEQRDEMNHQLQLFEAMRVAQVPTVAPLACVAHWGLAAPTTQHPEQRMQREDRLVFPNLGLAGFASGLPPVDDMDLRHAWLEAVVVALRKLHAAGYQHFDIHPDNVLWRAMKAVDVAGTALVADDGGDGGAAAVVVASPPQARAAAAGAYWAAAAAKAACRDNRERIEVLLVDMDSTCRKAFPLPEMMMERLEESPWAQAYPTDMVGGQPAPPHVDWYLLLGTVSLLRWNWDGDLHQLRRTLKKTRATFMATANELGSWLDDVTIPASDAVKKMTENAPPSSPLQS